MTGSTLLLWILQGLVSVSSIRLTRTLLPSHAILGEDVVLECGYDMEGDRLYSVKWYRNGKEFYRHIPSDSPPTAVFSQPGLVVDEVHSTETRIVLKRVQLSSEGSYLCEVSGEAPLFQTAKNENYLSVVDLPDQGPLISGTLPRYKKGDVISANCSSISSVPAAKLNWYINGEEATASMLVPYPPIRDSRGGLSSVLGLRIRVKENTFSKTGDIKIKCTATIQTIYWKSNEESIQGHRDNSFFAYDSSFWNSAAHPIVSASSTIYSQTKIFAVLLLHSSVMVNIL